MAPAAVEGDCACPHAGNRLRHQATQREVQDIDLSNDVPPSRRRNYESRGNQSHHYGVACKRQMSTVLRF
jgi:hypothetical protein